MSKLDIAVEMRAFDTKDRGFYDSLTDEERKKFSTYMMLKWGASVQGIPDLQEWYIRAHNERVNLNFFDLARHPKLQWLVCTTVSPKMGAQRHYWLKAKTTRTSPVLNFLHSQFPHLKQDELELLSKQLTDTDIRKYAVDLGWDDRRIKDELSM